MREHAAYLSREAVLLYFFLTAVADRHGMSFYGDDTVAVQLRTTLPAPVQAREELLARDLIAHEVRFTQVLSLPPLAVRRRSEPGQGLMHLGEIFTRLPHCRIPTGKGACHERRFMGRNSPLGRDREALRLGHCTPTPLLTAHGGRSA